MQIFYKDGRLFKIDDTQLPEAAKTVEIINGLYAAVYNEFSGAVNNPKYKNLSIKGIMIALNIFAEKWLTDKGLL